jgi:hypothetical protein
MATPPAPSCFKVRFFDAAASRKGRGVRVAYFATEAAAAEFAQGKSLYARPAKVEPVAALSGDQLAVAYAAAFGVAS